MGTLRPRYRTARPSRLVRTGAGTLLTSSTPADPVVDAFAIELWFSLADYTPAADVFLVQQGTADPSRYFALEWLTTGQPRASFYTAGTLATRLGTAATNTPTLTDGEPIGLRVHWLENFLGVASAYAYEFNQGGAWSTSPLVTAGLASAAAPTGQPVTVGSGGAIEALYDLKIWNGVFGPSQLIGTTASPNPRVADARTGMDPGAAAWTDEHGAEWAVGANAEVQRSDIPLPAAA